MVSWPDSYMSVIYKKRRKKNWNNRRKRGEEGRRRGRRRDGWCREEGDKSHSS